MNSTTFQHKEIADFFARYKKDNNLCKVVRVIQLNEKFIKI